MATLGGTLPTLLDLNQNTDPDGSQADVIELLAQSNELIQDIYWEEGNLPTGHRTTVRTSNPTVSSRELNAGVSPGKSTVDQFTDGIAILEAYSVVDAKLAEMAPSPSAFRANENAAFVEAFGQKVTSLWFNGNSITTPSDFTGLAPRYNDLNGLTGGAIIDAGGSSADVNASMWLLGHGPRGVAGIYNQGGTAGFKSRDMGEQMWQTSTTLGATTSALRAYVSWFEWTCGLSVRDWRAAIRIANISVSEASLLSGDQALTAYGTQLLNMMILAYHKRPKTSNLRWAFYANRTVNYALHIMALNKASSQITIDQVGGQPVTMFLGIPVRTVDQLGITEAVVTTSTVSI